MLEEILSSSVEGTVVRAESSMYEVMVAGGRTIPCVLRGRLKKKRQRVTTLVVVGDRVAVSEESSSAVIEEVLKRRNVLARPGFKGIEHVIAANVDLLLAVVSAREPPFKPNLVERFLVLAHASGIPALVVLSKVDLATDEEIAAMTAPFTATGSSFVHTSMRSGVGLTDLRARLGGRLSVLFGQSGVGKSSLLGALLPDVTVTTGGLSVKGKGKHTTTASRCYLLPEGGILVDTPGIKSLGIAEAAAIDAVGAFPEIADAAAGCRFRDCRHDREPDCAVRDAVEAGDIDARRFHNFARVRDQS